jgi:4-amino-4-deoxy-L-arabinose transferase-like glycosyltransferase
MLLTSALVRLGADPIPATRILGVASGVLILIILFLAVRRQRGAGAGPYLLCLPLLASNGCFAAWSLSGMETVFFTLLLLCALLTAMRNPRSPLDCFLAGFLFGLAGMARPEGLLFFSLTLPYFLLPGNRSREGGRMKGLIFLFAGFALVLLRYLAWKYSYYGSLVPNTFRAKGGVDAEKTMIGLAYLRSFMAVFGAPAFFLAFVFLRPRERQRNLYLVALLCVYLLYVALMGGDHMPAFRFLVPILPLFYLLAIEGMLYLSEVLGRRAPSASPALIWALALILIAGNAAAAARFLGRAQARDPAAFIGEKVGLWMRDHWPRDAKVALNTAGSTPYYSDLVCIDMLGITDPRVASRKITRRLLPSQLVPGHEKGDGAYVLSRKPDFIILGGAEGGTRPRFLGDLELLRSPEFRESYGYRSHRIPVNDPEARNYPASRNGEILFQFYERRPPGRPDTAAPLRPQELLDAPGGR